MASRVNVCSANILNNPARFGDPINVEIVFEAIESLPEDLEWELVYVGSAESEDYDQILDSVLVGPVVEGRHKFVFQADAPDPTKIPANDVVGVTVLLLRCSYREQQFIKIGWFVATEYTDPELKENPPSAPLLDKLERTVCTDDVRVTSLAIKWDDDGQEESLQEMESEDTEGTGDVSMSSSGEQMEVEEEQEEDNDDEEDDGDEEDQRSERSGSESISFDSDDDEDDDEKDEESGDCKSSKSSTEPLADLTNDSIPDLVD